MRLEPHLKVLAVDDTPTIVKLIEVVLSSRGHMVETAQDGPTALRRYDQFKPRHCHAWPDDAWHERIWNTNQTCGPVPL